MASRRTLRLRQARDRRAIRVEDGNRLEQLDPVTLHLDVHDGGIELGNRKCPFAAGLPVRPRSVGIQNSLAESPRARKMSLPIPPKRINRSLSDRSGKDCILKCGESYIGEFGRPEEPRLAAMRVVRRDTNHWNGCDGSGTQSCSKQTGRLEHLILPQGSMARTGSVQRRCPHGLSKRWLGVKSFFDGLYQRYATTR